jgi:mannose-1-phosphate guanylyltransferase
MKVKAVIMAGGAGERFWPKSREKRPKQLLPITNDRSMIRNTVDRVKALVPASDIMILTRSSYAGAISRVVPELPPGNIIGEPEGRNTAPCIGLAAVSIKEPDAVMMIFPSDHVIFPVNRFKQTLKWAAVLAEKTDNLVTIGIKPSYGSTAYGYIKEGEKLRVRDLCAKTVRPEGVEAYAVNKFIEKPDKRTAEKFVNNGGYLWNSGIFVWRKKVILNAMNKFLPDTFNKLNRLDKKNIKKIYHGIGKVSIDYGILEKAGNRIVIAADFDWNDVGSWEALSRCFQKDGKNNISQGKVLNIDTKNTMVFTEKELVVTLGVEGLIVVSTGDALLVMKNGRGEEVKEVVSRLKADSRLKKYF